MNELNDFWWMKIDLTGVGDSILKSWHHELLKSNLKWEFISMFSCQK